MTDDAPGVGVSETAFDHPSKRELVKDLVERAVIGLQLDNRKNS